MFGVLFKVLPESDDKIVHGAGFGAPVVAPADFEQFATRNWLAAVSDKEF